MLLPISHTKMTTRRIPVATVVIILLTVALHGLASVDGRGREAHAMSALLEALALRNGHPSFGVCAPLKPFVGSAPPLDMGRSSELERDPKEEEEAKVSYDAACKELADSVETLVSQKFGYVPARSNLLGLFTYTLVHEDWWHVLGNMWFLFLCGLALEDRWGRFPFVVFYVVSGVVAAGVHQLFTSDPTAALIGASGAVASAMGAFVVLFTRTKIRFATYWGLRFYTFEAAAYVMLPLWVVLELLFALLDDGSGTAHWAHVGGFSFGAAVAVGFRRLGVDRKLDDAVERVAVLGDDPRVDAANAMVTSGDAKSAVVLLEGLALEKPESIHVWQALHDAARASGNAALAERAAKKTAEIDARRDGATTSSRPPPSGASRTPSSPPARASRPSAPAVASTSGAAVEPAPFFPTFEDKKGDGPGAAE